MKVSKEIPVDSSDQTPSTLSSTPSDSGVLHGRDVSKDAPHFHCGRIMFVVCIAFAMLTTVFVSVAGYVLSMKKAAQVEVSPNEYIVMWIAMGFLITAAICVRILRPND